MALVVYATADYLAAQPPAGWGVPTDDAPTLLRSASIRVAAACQRNPYIDEPDDAAAAALRDATCATVAAWVALGIDPAAGGLDAQIVSAAKLLTGDVTLQTAGRLPAYQQAVAEVGPEARAILQLAGLLYVPSPLSSNIGLPDWGTGAAYGPLGLGAWLDQEATDVCGDVAAEAVIVVIDP